MTGPIISPAGVIQTEPELSIAASPDAVWKALIEDINQWWLPDFHVAGPDSTVILEPHVGGRFYEENADGSGVFGMSVVTIQPPERLIMTGTIAPPWGGPATSVFSVELAVAEGPKTVVRASDYIYGKVDTKLHKSLSDGWKYLFEAGLKKHVEST